MKTTYAVRVKARRATTADSYDENRIFQWIWLLEPMSEGFWPNDPPTIIGGYLHGFVKKEVLTSPAEWRTNEQIYYDALKLIARGYESSEGLLSSGYEQWLSDKERLATAYDNVKLVAEEAIKGRKRPK